MIKKSITSNTTDMTGYYYIDTLRRIPDAYQRGVYLLAIETVCTGIKKMLKNGVKSNDDAYTQLFGLQSRYWSLGYCDETYIRDMIQLTYLDILDAETTPDIIDTIGYLGMYIDGYIHQYTATDHGLHLTYCNKVYRHLDATKRHNLLQWLRPVVNLVRTHYRNKGDMVERCETSTVNKYRLHVNGVALDNQNAEHNASVNELLQAVMDVVNSCTKHQRQIFTLRAIDGLSFNQISDITDTTFQNASKTYNRVIAYIRSQISFTDYLDGEDMHSYYINALDMLQETIE